MLDGRIKVVALESLKENAVNLFHSGILFIFSMKNLFINGIQAFELLFYKDRERPSPKCLKYGQLSYHSGDFCLLGCYIIYLC